MPEDAGRTTDRRTRPPGRRPPARLAARPAADAAGTLRPGRSALGLGGERDGILHVPSAAPAGRPALVVVLHGAGSSADAALGLLADLADAHGLLVLAPDARGSTWDVMTTGFGRDVAFIDRALAHVFASCPVDPARIALAGFSDGASYALSLGLANGDLFSRLIAFSPGFCAPSERVGRPRIFVTHGVADRVLPIGRCSRRLVPALRAGGYAVDYEEFDGGHVVPADLARRAVALLA